MSMIKDMKTYLISKGVSVPIYLGSIPEGNVECIGLYRYSGQAVLKEADIERIGLQVKCLSADYEEAHQNANLVQNLLWQIGDEDECGDLLDIDGTKYVRVIPKQSGECVKNDEYVEMVQNFIVEASLVK